MKVAATVMVSQFAGVMRRVARRLTERAMQAGRLPKPRPASKSEEPRR